ncbi:hypothetical protein M407DRAFT_35011 [Tulasnella calospora MUT 4182]|uniref:Uncharacterized protein n=1 Tax=Tulasnella calospora MUT 4182 TaxID=1051891 RepID=A0A0C3PM75_9AGAM|nr:hypothetical protein M407DRAFT_35011 [Tulasnella calospora MUT 4182]
MPRNEADPDCMVTRSERLSKHSQFGKPSQRTRDEYDEVYDATQGLKRKNEEGAKLNEDLSLGDLVALELHIKRYSRKDEKVRHASYELVVVQLLCRGSPDDLDEVKTLVTPAKTNAFGEDFFAEM